MMRSQRVWFTSDEDRESCRKGMRILALVYAGIGVLVVAVTALRVDLHQQESAAKATASVVSAAAPAHPLRADLGREPGGMRQ
jgi:hypothetical protein